MQAARRLGVAFLLFVLAFLVLVALAAGSLFMVGQVAMASVVAGTGVAGVVAGGIAYRMVRRDMDALDVVVEHEVPLAAAEERKPLRVQTMPVADLPPEYVAAVMQGARARLSALKAQASSSDLHGEM
jgi:hypothetical protein